jgi:hypothetical protein
MAELHAHYLVQVASDSYNHFKDMSILIGLVSYKELFAAVYSIVV